ncbi:MAG: UDP-glucose 4-epimerase [Candidatus Cloacimonadota bacterium]|nr:MAG: UDP-glucose 4-epimerase [Candidatus Cloacimonadota bacterium]
MKILFTGITGFIGRRVARKFIKRKHELTALIRPGTAPERISEFRSSFNFAEIDLADTEKLKSWLAENKFDLIYHIGAVRGGRKFPREIYCKANIDATEQLALNAFENESKLIFCSSVGVFGAIPRELPANSRTARQRDTYYHYTKIQAESIIQKYVLNGLNAVIIRPSITYGPGDYGFPYTLIKLIDKKLFLMPDRPVKIHLSHVETMAEAFAQAGERYLNPGSEYIVADVAPVELKELADFISMKLREEPYPQNRIIPHHFFDLGKNIARKIKSDVWKSRFELISESWYYDTCNSLKDLNIHHHKTIPDFKIVIDWYKKNK